MCYNQTLKIDFSEDILKIKKAIFPLGVFGSRMMPITKSIPKGMLPVANKPLLHYTVEEALASGITELIFVVGNNEAAIKSYFDGSIHELNHLVSKIRSIRYIKQKEALGLETCHFVCQRCD